ncbi:TPA: DNA mismatch repair protein [Candidatus Magasanikbacteria bacterium]|nr:DNA mismatch repair protein [Candidatus Magasanikbacteria bacterium]
MVLERSEINKLLNNSDKSLMEVYLDLHEEFSKKYGANTVVLMEVGSFFEVYGVDNEQEKIGNPKEVTEILNLQLTRKNKAIKENNRKNTLMAGFPSATFDRYIQKITRENKYTIVIIRQKGTPPNVTRYLDTILSPGINFDFCQNNEDNFITSLNIDENKGIYSIGYTAVDIATGKSYILEINSTREDKTYALDHVFSLLKSHRTTEIIINYANDEIDEKYLEHYLELDEIQIHHNQKRLNIDYQNELFKQTYLIKSFLSPIEFLDLEKKALASESLAILLEFVIEHDYLVIQKLNKPEHLNSNKYLYLGNNPLEQLNIFSSDKNKETILSLIDYTMTSMGKRLLQERLLSPIIDKDELNSRYDLSENLQEYYLKVEQELRSVYDLERIKRRLQIGRLHPFEINFLYDSLQASKNIIEILSAKSERKEKLKINLFLENNNIENALLYLEHTFALETTCQVASKDITDTIFKTGFSVELDELIIKKNLLEKNLENIRLHIANLIKEKTGKDENDFVIIKQLDKEGHYISITKSRYYLIEDSIKETDIILDNEIYPGKSLQIKIQTGNVKITSDLIENYSESIVLLQNKITAIVKELFKKELEQLDNKYSQLLSVLIFELSCLDVAISNLKASLNLNLKRPEIIATDEQYVELKQVRHLLVEAREENGIYVPNNVVLGAKNHLSEDAKKTVIAEQLNDDILGILLYGINSSGKSSLMKSVGVTILLAQSGLFVPAEKMRFTIFTEIFTRIVAQDNFSKGLSSFAVEMLELKNIFNRATKHSLVLGDEISHGTENLSALAIVAATIKRLIEIKSLFIFTTHLHSLHNLNLVQNLKNLASVHLSVRYDRDNDKLIFDRILQAGSGSSVYGLEFAQSLHMDEKFLEMAVNIRKELSHDYDDIELLTKKKTSIYNKKLFVTNCSICKEKVDDVHHISPQQIADKNGNIGHFHKDHKYNLIPLCKKCHDDIHHGHLKVKGYKMTSDGLELEVE